MKVEIIVTYYNNPSYLDKCLESLFEQTYSNFTCLVIDDNSTERHEYFQGKLNLMDQRFRFIRNEENVGGPNLFMEYISGSKADYIMWLHHDDWLHPNFLEKSLYGLEKNQEVSFSYSLCSRVIDGISTNEFPGSIRPDLSTGMHDISYDTVINCWIMWSSALIRRSSYEQVGGLRSLYHRYDKRKIKSVYRKGESDLYIFAKLSSLSQVYVINERLCYYRDHSDSNTNNTFLRGTHIQDNIRTYDYIYDEIEYFTDEIRVVSKINSIGRLSLKNSFADTAYNILYQSMLGKEYYLIRD
jgi:glycosyltransferase involved in cell wall biosynthesis